MNKYVNTCPYVQNCLKTESETQYMTEVCAHWKGYNSKYLKPAYIFKIFFFFKLYKTIVRRRDQREGDVGCSLVPWLILRTLRGTSEAISAIWRQPKGTTQAFFLAV